MVRWWLSVALCSAPLAAQVTATASVTGNLAASVGGYRVRDREVYGVRYRTPALGRLTAQVGLVATAENGIVFPSDGEGMRHWAAALEYRVVGRLRAQGIFGNIVEIRDASKTAPGVPPSNYYQMTGAALTYEAGARSARVERLLSTPRISTAALHEWVVAARSPALDVTVQRIRGGAGQPRYAFVVAEATVRPFARRSGVVGAMGVQGGRRTLMSYTENRHVPVRFLATGLFFHFRGR